MGFAGAFTEGTVKVGVAGAVSAATKPAVTNERTREVMMRFLFMLEKRYAMVAISGYSMIKRTNRKSVSSQNRDAEISFSPRMKF